MMVCEECLPSLFAGCSKLVMEKSISGAYAADTVIGVQKRLEHMSKDDESTEIKETSAKASRRIRQRRRMRGKIKKRRK